MQRVGLGFDSHRFDPARALVLGGVRIEDSPGLAGHSDGDAVLHALTDAILGALAAGDIGEHFPDTDPRWAGVESRVFLTEALRIARQKRMHAVNCDVTVVAERPRLSAHKPAMAARIAELLGVPAERVSVKAKTSEQMGALGRGEGLAALAVVLLSDEG
jgi:2-C-methyl-D-erythritol 2,4-cyclodiphosphate synthase